VNSKRQDLRLDDPWPTCEFGEFRLDVRHRSLSRAGQPVPTTARALDTLICLVRHRGTLLSRETLMDLVWPHSDVEPNNLSQTIKKLRRLLGEKPGENRFVETVPGRGYRFISFSAVRPPSWQSLWAPELLALRRDPRFRGLVDQLGFAPYWDAHGPPDCAAVRQALGL
jgi:hypothetical protein